MIAYAIDYKIKGKNMEYPRCIHVDAKNLASAKKKIGRKYGYKSGRMVEIYNVCVCGYY